MLLLPGSSASPPSSLWLSHHGLEQCLEEDCGWRDGWGSATVRAVSDASCSEKELRAGTEAASTAWVPAAGVEAEGFGHKWRLEVLFATSSYLVRKEQPYLPEIKKMNK